MTKTYSITGMTCNGCRNSVEETLKGLSGVVNAKVDLEKGEAEIEMSKTIPLDDLSATLPAKYTISNIEMDSVLSNAIEEKSTLKQLFPLFLIFIFIIGASILLNYAPWDMNGFMLDFMGLFYVVFSFFKFLDLKGFPASFRMYDPLAKTIPLYGYVYPFIELGLGLLFLMRLHIPKALIITLVILGITTFGVTRTLLNKKSIQCACLGTALKLPMTKATFIENTVMIIMAIVMLAKIYN